MEPLIIPPIKSAFEIYWNILQARILDLGVDETELKDKLNQKEEWLEFRRILFNEYRILNQR